MHVYIHTYQRGALHEVMMLTCSGLRNMITQPSSTELQKYILTIYLTAYWTSPLGYLKGKFDSVSPKLTSLSFF